MRGAYIIVLGLTTMAACRGPEAPVAPPDAERDPAADGMTRYVIDARLDPEARTIEGRERIVWFNRSDATVDTVRLHLYLEAFRDAETLYRQGGEASGVDYGEGGGIDLVEVKVAGEPTEPVVVETKMSVELEREVAPGGSVDLEIAWIAHMPPIAERTGCVRGFCFAGQWYPKVARIRSDGTWPVQQYHHNAEYDAERAHHDVTVSLPEGWAFASTGAATCTEEGQGGRRCRFGGARKDVAFAAGRDHGIVTDAGLAGDPLLVVMHPPGRAREARRTIDILRRCLPVMREHYGPFAYPSLTTVIVPGNASGAGGMEYPGLITTPGADPPWSPVRARDPVLYHELMHQVFFGKLDTNEVEEPWIDEGFTTWSALDLQAQVEGTERPEGFRMGHVGLDLYETYRMMVAWNDEWLSARMPARRYPSHVSYAEHVYGRPATAIETARRVWGEGPVRAALGTLAEEHGGGRITGDDVDRHLAAAFGPGFLASYLDPALESPTPPGWAVTGMDGTVTLERTGAVELPVDVLVELDGGEERWHTWRGPEESIDLAGTRARSVIVDPEGKVLIDANRLDNGMSGSILPAPGRIVSFFSLVLVAAQSLGTWVLP